MAQPRDGGEGAAGDGLSDAGPGFWQHAGSAGELELELEHAGQSGRIPRSWQGITTSIQNDHNTVAKIRMPYRMAQVISENG